MFTFVWAKFGKEPDRGGTLTPVMEHQECLEMLYNHQADSCWISAAILFL